MTQQSILPRDTLPSEGLPAQATGRIGGSLLPSSEPLILQRMEGPHGALQVRPLPELDTYGLFFGDGLLLATHPNGYSCHALAERILAAWSGVRDVAYVLAQFDYILACGGLGRQRDSIEHIARGLPRGGERAASGETGSTNDNNGARL